MCRIDERGATLEVKEIQVGYINLKYIHRNGAEKNQTGLRNAFMQNNLVLVFDC